MLYTFFYGTILWNHRHFFSAVKNTATLSFSTYKPGNIQDVSENTLKGDFSLKAHALVFCTPS
jgi:hypothetical protein